MKGNVARRISHIKHRMRELGIIENNKLSRNAHRIGMNKLNAYIAFNIGWFIGAVCVFAVFIYALNVIVQDKIIFLPDVLVNILEVVDMRRSGNWTW